MSLCYFSLWISKRHTQCTWHTFYHTVHILIHQYSNSEPTWCSHSKFSRLKQKVFFFKMYQPSTWINSTYHVAIFKMEWPFNGNSIEFPILANAHCLLTHACKLRIFMYKPIWMIISGDCVICNDKKNFPSTVYN